MTYDPLLIAPYKSGLIQYYKPFLIGNDAFTELDNCYSWRGIIKKREGSLVLARTPVYRVVNAINGITNASPPVVTTSTAHGLLTGDMVYLENVVTNNGTVSTIATGFPTIVTTTGNHGMSAGQTVFLTGVNGVIGGTTQDPFDFNNEVYSIISVTPTTMSLNTTSTGTYTSGGTVFVAGLDGRDNNESFVITVTGANTFTLQNLNTGVNFPASGAAQSADIYLPIVGTRIFIISSSGDERLIVFTPRQAFQFNPNTNVLDNISFDTTTAAIVWQGTKDNFFYTSNYATVMWATNNIANTTLQPTGIRFYNGSLTAGWSDFQPQLSTGRYLNSALIVLPYKGRLVVLNTLEGGNAPPPGQANQNFFSRARWSQIGTPFVANAPTGFSNDANAWRDDIPGRGGFIDADTSERIISASIIQDTLIVSFQFSTWRLTYTGNETLPFIWERINNQLGSEGTFSDVPFDDRKLTISRRGIVGCSFNSVERIDLLVPDFVDSFEAGQIGEGLNRIQGIRDFQKRLVYWIYGDQADNAQTPNKILCYNYVDNTWATFTQSFTTLGNYKKTTDNTWSTWTSIWDGDTSTWDTPLDQSNTILVVAGDKTGRVWEIMDSEVSTDNGVNYNFSITTNVINPYFQQGRRCKLAYYDLYTTTTSNGEITLYNYIDNNENDPWLIKTVQTNNVGLPGSSEVKYIRVFLGMVARNHQITITLTPEQLADEDIGGSDFEIQGIIMHTRMEGRIKQ